ncbi:MAG: LysR substrate-binding domain-containing protein [Geminicoccaceae bacterium]
MRLPSLNGLRAFEAAARHESFALAAAELHVTPGAVSRHVKLLEEEIGSALFRRLAHGLELTPAGRALQPELASAFERMERAVRRAGAAERELRIIAAPTFAMRWLVPRLPSLRRRHPELRVSVGLFRDGYEDFREGGYDLGIETLGFAGRRPELMDLVPLRAEALTPLCAPSLLHGDPPLRRPEDLARHVLLHPTEDRIDWRLWLRTAGLPDGLADGGLVFATMEMALGATIGGLGLTVGDLHLVGPELAAGRVVAPFDLVVTEGTGYLLFAERGRFAEPRFAAFRDWILAELAADKAALALPER